ncbi:MAG TPA: LacI family transcriptional regulator [Epulopiscium sp.]|nr:LacI family transcriptional regulator [Candidatus Epulonipiscium sp.]
MGRENVSVTLKDIAKEAVILGRFNKDILKFLKKNIKNLVYAGVNYVDGGIDEVICDGYKGGCTAVEHLISLGHRKIGFVGTTGINKEFNLINEKGICIPDEIVFLSPIIDTVTMGNIPNDDVKEI